VRGVRLRGGGVLQVLLEVLPDGVDRERIVRQHHAPRLRDDGRVSTPGVVSCGERLLVAQKVPMRVTDQFGELAGDPAVAEQDIAVAHHSIVRPDTDDFGSQAPTRRAEKRSRRGQGSGLW
jgi:hypothetical protein